MNEELASYLLAQSGIPMGAGGPMMPAGPEEEVGELVDPSIEKRLDNPIVKRMVEQALDPSDTMEVKITKEGEVKADMFKPDKPKGEGGEVEAKTGEDKNLGYGPAMAAMSTPGGEPISAAELRGLSPEQISSIMSGEARSEQLRQGTIGQLMDLPYRQALTEKALRPELTPEQKIMMAEIQKSLNPMQQFTLFKGLTQYQTTRKLLGKTLEDMKKLYAENPMAFEGAPKDLIDQVTEKEEKLEERMYQDAEGEYWWGLFEPGAEEPTRPKLRKATKKDLEFKEIEVSPLAEKKFERMKEMDAAQARKWIADSPKLPENKEYIHQANRDSKDKTLYIWEKPGLIFGGKAHRIKLPEGFLAGHFEPDMTERLQEGETIGPFRHPKTGERTMLKIVEGEVVIVE